MFVIGLPWAARVDCGVEQAPEQGPTQASRLLVNPRLVRLDEDVGRADLVGFDLAVRWAEREVSVPGRGRSRARDEEARPRLAVAFEEGDGATPFGSSGRAERGFDGSRICMRERQLAARCRGRRSTAIQLFTGSDFLATPVNK